MIIRPQIPSLTLHVLQQWRPKDFNMVVYGRRRGFFDERAVLVMSQYFKLDDQVAVRVWKLGGRKSSDVGVV